MAFTDIQNTVGQTQMANQILLAKSRKDRDDARKKKKDKINLRKQQDKIKAAEEKARKEDREYYKGLDPNAKVYNRDGQEVLDDGSIVVDEDMRTNGPIIDPNNLLQIGGKALDLLKFVPQMMIRGGNQIAGRPGYHTTTNGGFVNQAGKVFYNDNGVLRPDGDYDEKIHGALIPPIGLDQANNSMQINPLIANFPYEFDGGVVTPRYFTPPKYRNLPFLHMRTKDITDEELFHFNNFIRSMGGGLDTVRRPTPLSIG